MKLHFTRILTGLPGMNVWGAERRGRTFIITQDTTPPAQRGLDPERLYNRFCISVNYLGRKVELGIFDTFEEASAAAEAGGVLQ